MSWVILAQHTEEAGFWVEYTSLLTDKAHLAFELTLQFIVDFLLISLVYPRVKKYVVKRHDQAFHEGEHG